MCYLGEVTDVGLREMRQNASELVRRAEAGERFTVTVAGRPAALLGPVMPRAWRTWSEVSDVLGDPVDTTWSVDMDRLDHEPVDPWSRT